MKKYDYKTVQGFTEYGAYRKYQGEIWEESTGM